MRLRTLVCVLLAAALLTLATAAAEAAGTNTGAVKLGKSGQVYVWQSGGC
ncbi:MAG: hypothetical protein QNJ90_01090 [Planctomycetota bacterium]|nr:hypothetical protein [Planctomycetota bacterium]